MRSRGASQPRSSGSSTGPREEPIAMAGKFIKGALVEFTEAFIVPIPNVIAFQFNPETMTHTWSQAATFDAGGKGANPLAVKGDPGESFSFSLAMDAGDTIATGSPVTAGLATVSGIYSRLAALEMLQYPVEAKKTKATAGRKVPKLQLPTVLFIWGPGRILPVRVMSLTITEKLYDALLNPTHADAAITLQVLTRDEIEWLTGPLAELASTAYKFSHKLREGLAVANLANTADSVLGMLPV
jgi:hypothetical protein